MAFGDSIDCTFPECVNVAAANPHGLCFSHAKQFQRRGDLDKLTPLRSGTRPIASKLDNPKGKVAFVDWTSVLLR